MMATDPNENPESTKECMAKIDKIIGDALGNETSGSGSKTVSKTLGDAKGMGDFSPSASPERITNDVSKIVFSPARDTYNSTKSSSTLSGMANSESPMKRHDYEIRPYTKDSFLSNAGKESRSTGPTDVSDNWVNYQFERLVTDRKSNPRSTAASEANSSNMSQFIKMKNIEDILREYSSSDPTKPNHYNPVSQSCGMSSSRASSSYRMGWMNRSHNNETLDSPNPEMDQMRRVGSSVDGDVGDVLKSFGAKCSLSGTRCSSSQMSDGEENKLSLGLPRDSEVDFKRAPNSGRVELSEIRTDLSDLNYSFQKERERLRHLETLIRKTPATSSSRPESAHNLRSHNYTSRFLNDYTGRRAFSVSDYSKYSGADWKPSSPAADYLGRTSSSMSYKNVGGLYSPTSRTNYLSDYNPTQFTSSGFDMGMMSSMLTHKPETREYEADPIGHSTYNYNNYPKSTSSGSFSKTKLNRSHNAKKDRNMSKSLSDSYEPRRKSSFMKTFSKKPSTIEARRYVDNSDSRHDHQSSIFKTESKSRNKPVSPKSSLIFDMYRGQAKKNPLPKTKPSKFQPYQPYVPQDVNKFSSNPKCTKSEISTLDTVSWANHFSRKIDSESDGECDPVKNRWTSALFSSDSGPRLVEDSRNEMPLKGNQECNYVQQKTESKIGKKNFRSKSECRVPNNNVSGWNMQSHDQFATSSNGSSKGKRVGRKLKPKIKKGTPSVVKSKKNTTKRK